MTKPVCRDCGSEEVVWGTGKNGRPVLYDKKPRPHFIGCKKRPQKAGGPYAEALEILTGKQMGYKVGEAKEMLRGIPVGDVAAMVGQAVRESASGGKQRG